MNPQDRLALDKGLSFQWIQFINVLTRQKTGQPCLLQFSPLLMKNLLLMAGNSCLNNPHFKTITSSLKNKASRFKKF